MYRIRIVCTHCYCTYTAVKTKDSLNRSGLTPRDTRWNNETDSGALDETISPILLIISPLITHGVEKLSIVTQ